MTDAAIGVFDSGLGGLSVLRHVRATLPQESLCYVADSAHVPYGSKSPDYIIQRSEHITRFLLAQGCKALVIACNTATAAAAAWLREQHPDVPIVAMEPAVKPAVTQSRNQVIGVLATEGTLKSAQFAALLARFGSGVTVVTQPCHGLVELIEQGALQADDTRALLQHYMEPLLAAGVDTIVLGCTHYPFVAPLIRTLAGPDVALIDTGSAVARQLQRRLTELGLLNTTNTAPQDRFFSSAAGPEAERITRLLWGAEVSVQPLPG